MAPSGAAFLDGGIMRQVVNRCRAFWHAAKDELNQADNPQLALQFDRQVAVGGAGRAEVGRGILRQEIAPALEWPARAWLDRDHPGIEHDVAAEDAVLAAAG